MVWLLASTENLSKRGTFSALLDVTSSAVFTALQHLGMGCFGFLLGRFGGAFDFFRFTNALTFSTGVFELGDCPLTSLR